MSPKGTWTGPAVALVLLLAVCAEARVLPASPAPMADLGVQANSSSSPARLEEGLLAATAQLTSSPTERFSDEFPIDLMGSTITFSAPSYQPCIARGLKVLPEDITDATRLHLGDDDSQRIDFSDSFAFPFYGNLYASAFVSSNGIITFEAAETAFEPRIGNHFSSPRISALFSDLAPDGQARIVWIERSDRVIITYLDVPSFGDDTVRNTFQVVLHKNGTVTIAFLELYVHGSKIVGLSSGAAPSGDWHPTDFTAIEACEGAQDVSVASSPAAPALATPDPTPVPPGGPLFCDGMLMFRAEQATGVQIVECTAGPAPVTLTCQGDFALTHRPSGNEVLCVPAAPARR